jgi:hypothetical protein
MHCETECKTGVDRVEDVYLPFRFKDAHPGVRQSFGVCLSCFDRIVIHGYLSGFSRPEQVVHFFRQIVGVTAVDKEVLSRGTADFESGGREFESLRARQ